MLRDRVLITTIAVSVLVHLSMVTLFSIYVWVPVNRPRYAQLEIKYLGQPGLTLAAMDLSLHMPTLGPTLDEGTPDPEAGERANLSIPQPESGPAPLALPEISLPSLDTKLLERAEMVASSAGVRSSFEPAERQDFWARAIGQIGRLDDRLRELTPLESVFPDAAEPVRPVPIARPAAGLAMYIEWTGEPRERKLALGAPIDSLWRVDVAAMGRPISVPFKVNAQGEVTYVLPPPEDDVVLQSVSDALRRFRFAPLDAPNAPEQIGTLVIAREAAP